MVNLEAMHADVLINSYKNCNISIYDGRPNLNFWSMITAVTEGIQNTFVVFIQDSSNPPEGVSVKPSLGIRYLIEDIVARGYSELPQDRQLPLVPMKVHVQIYDGQTFTVQLKFREFNCRKQYDMLIKYHLRWKDDVVNILKCNPVS